jgi:solute carrier family 13 (sodium-dependent dicarboxylate transporter), member 2/3/5
MFSDSEIKETISLQEEKFEWWRNTIGAFLGPLIALLIYLIPIPSISERAHILASILGWVVIWWVTEPIPIPATSILGVILCVVFNVGNAKTVLAPFADPIIFLFLGSFVLAQAMAIHKLDKRFAYSIMSVKWIGNSTGRILFVYGAITAFISMWISNTASTAMMLPIGIGIIYATSDLISNKLGKKVDPAKLRFATGMMLMTAYSASAGGIGTPVGTPPNLIGIAMIDKFAHVKIPFFKWMLITVPILIVIYVFLFYILYFMHKPEVTRIEGSSEYVNEEFKKLGKWTRGQKNTLIAFFVTVTLWVIPGFLDVFYGSSNPFSQYYNTRIPESIAALTGMILLFVIPIDWKKRQFTITWKEAVNIDWGTLLLFGGGLTLGSLMFETKLADSIGSSLFHFTGAASVWSITFVAIFIAIVFSEASSNTASANMIVPVMISLSIAAGINPIPPAIGATLGASWGFMLPISTPPNAIVYGSGMVPIRKMIRTGIVFDIIGGIIIWLGLRLLLPMVGLG